MAEYLLADTLKPETTQAAAYYTAEEKARAFWDNLTERGRQAMGGTVAELRPDMSPAMAERLGIVDIKKPLTEEGIANLLNTTRMDGSAIVGRKKHSATYSVAEVFGLDPKEAPSAAAIRNVLAGHRADGEIPSTATGKELPKAVVDGARKRFKAALGVPGNGELTAEELTRLEAGQMATGRIIDLPTYRRQIHATRPPVGFVDLTFSADKSLSTAWALAPTAHEREVLLDIHKQAVKDTMTYAETVLGLARRGAGGKDGYEPGELAWISFQHYTSRPAVDIARMDKEGRAYTEIRELPLQIADPQLHTHVTVLNSVLTESGRVGAIDLDRLAGRVKELGAVYHAHVAARSRRLGVETVLDERTGAARLTAVPEPVRELFSKRRLETLHAARDFAKRHGADWDGMTGDQKIALLKAGAAETRQAKEYGKNDFAVWREQAAAMKYQHRSVIRPVARVTSEQPTEERHDAAYRASLPMVEEMFNPTSAVLNKTDGGSRRKAGRATRRVKLWC
jgi:hypothetical protein